MNPLQHESKTEAQVLLSCVTK